MVEEHIHERNRISGYSANQDLRYLRAAFNFGLERKLITVNPTKEIEFFPVEKKVKYVPSQEDIDKMIGVADPDTQDYLWTIRETMARVSEINRLTWEDVSLQGQYIILYTRKKRGGDLTPRKVAMTQKIFDVLSARYEKRDETKPWVFWHRYWSRKEGRFKVGPYNDRKKVMKSLCDNAGVRYFRFHALRHAGASVMDDSNVPLGAIQRILGHENRRTTEIYLHSIGDSERIAIEVYEQARQNSHTDSHTSSK
jgi:integrase